jgi:hypothetical protein
LAQNQQQKLTKQARVEANRLQAKKKKQRRNLLWVGGSVVVIAEIIALIVVNQKPLPGVAVEVMSDQTHVQDVKESHTPYSTEPPTSGPHLPYIADWGVHKEQLPRELLVHNLEDGGVVIYYNSKADATTVSKLESIVKGYPEHVLLAPNPALQDMITLTAWGRMEKLASLNEQQVTDFIDAFQGIDHHKANLG